MTSPRRISDRTQEPGYFNKWTDSFETEPPEAVPPPVNSEVMDGESSADRGTFYVSDFPD